MLNSIFNHISVLKKGLDASWTKHEVIANNIANNDTPGFKSSRVDFESIFKEALSDDGFVGKKTNEKHIDIGKSADLDNLNPIITKNTETSMRLDGNNVDINYEMTELTKNILFYNTLTQKINNEFSRLKKVINEGK